MFPGNSSPVPSGKERQSGGFVPQPYSAIERSAKEKTSVETSPKILELMEEWTGKFSIINFYLAICAKTDIRAYMADNLKLLDIGKPETLAAAEEWLRQNI